MRQPAGEAKERQPEHMLGFQFNEHFWTSKAQLPSWAGYQSRYGPYSSVSSAAPSDGSVTITYAPEGRDTSPLTEDELASVQWLLDHEGAIASALLNALLAEYPKLQEDYDDDERGEYMPDVSHADDFRALIGLHHVHVHPLVKDGIPYFGYEFGCTWEEEHGLGVLMHGTRVVQIGGADTALLLWLAKRDAGVAA
jgi:hypothetical protein